MADAGDLKSPDSARSHAGSSPAPGTTDSSLETWKDCQAHKRSVKVKDTKRTGERDHRAFALWAADCAEHVLACFEDNYPNDNRPRKAIEAGRAWARGEIRVGVARTAALAAHAAARDADHAAARAAARAAGHAAATAHVAAHARAAAAYAVKAAIEAATATVAETELEWQRRRLPKHLRPVAFRGRTGS